MSILCDAARIVVTSVGTEDDFQKMPLDFVRDGQAIMWNNGASAC